MTKRVTTLNLDDDLVKDAKESFVNLSNAAEEGIRNRLNKKQVEISTEIKNCEFCGREEQKATKENLNGLTWLWPDEKWICSSCLSKLSKSVLRCDRR